jgi:dihydroorotase
MSVLLKQVTIAGLNTGTAIPQDILIQNGIITAIADQITEAADQVIDELGLTISTGWVDLFCQFHDTGTEHKETLQTGAAAAAAGGFTDVFVVPNTAPAIHNKAQVEYVVQKAATLPTRIHPLGAITKNCEGKELAEMYDMRTSGAIAFSDGWKTVQSPQMMLKSLQYVKTFGGVLVQLPDEPQLSKNGLINEGIISTQLGLPGKPAIAESLMVARDLELLEYTGSRIHFTGISTQKSVDLIRQAKAKGLDVTCSVTPYHLCFTDEATTSYDTNFKVNPPLRSAADIAALKEAIMDGTIDCISSHHYPQDYDAKICEFEYAGYGMEGLETSYRAVLSALPDLTADRIEALFSGNARRIFNLAEATIEKDQVASFTLFSMSRESTVFEKKAIRSKCTNNAFIGQSLPGKVFGTIRGEQVFLND